MAALERDVRARFEGKMVAHLREFFPTRCATLGERGVREAVTRGVDRAGRHGFVVYGDVCSYLELAFAFGEGFDDEEPWAAEILAQPFAHADSKMKCLYAAAERRYAEAT